MHLAIVFLSTLSLEFIAVCSKSVSNSTSENGNDNEGAESFPEYEINEIDAYNSSMCLNRSDLNFLNCTKSQYEPDEYENFSNGSVLLDDELLNPGSYEFRGEILIACDPCVEESNNTGSDTPDIYIGKIGSGISIIALTLHLVIFCMVPSLRNLPGYNLASLSVAFIFGYSFLIIGQIPEVLGTACVVSGVLEQYFFLVAFFCMNVMAFDVWWTLKLTTEKFVLCSKSNRNKQLILYFAYSWGFPLSFSIATVLLDNIDGVPENFKPNIGKDDTCWITSVLAKTILFSVPAFTLFIINGVFFILSAFLIKSSTLKCTNNQQKQTAKLNYILYVKLALMMGITWLIGVIGIAAEDYTVWVIHDVLNSLQGLFIFLLFTCSKRVIKRIKEKVTNSTSKISSSDKSSTVASKLELSQSATV